MRISEDTSHIQNSGRRAGVKAAPWKVGASAREHHEGGDRLADLCRRPLWWSSLWFQSSRRKLQLVLPAHTKVVRSVLKPAHIFLSDQPREGCALPMGLRHRGHAGAHVNNPHYSGLHLLPTGQEHNVPSFCCGFTSQGSDPGKVASPQGPGRELVSICERPGQKLKFFFSFLH